VRHALGLALCAAILSGGCKRPAPPAGLTLPTVPSSMPVKLGVEFDAAVELLGGKLEPSSGLKPGSRVELTLYWRKRASVDKGYRLFTHVLDEAGERILNLDEIGPLRKVVAGEAVHPPSSWDEDVVYVDQQAFSVPSTLRTDSFSIVTGLFRGSERLKITRGPHQGERAVVVKATVSRPTPVSTALPQLWVPRRRPNLPIVIDGKLDEPAWMICAHTGPFVNVATGEAPSGEDVAGSVKLVYDEQALYLGFEVFDDDLRGGFDPTQPDPHLWTRDTIELMIDPDEGDNLDYYEIQVGPQNLVFDSQFDSYNRPKVEPSGPFGHQEWSAGLTSAVTLHGTLDDDKEDDGYIVELSIPWTSFGKAKRVPPAPKDVWRMNFYAIENNGGAAWSPILGQGNFHLGSRFGRVRFSK
jgi:hypothetical protein